MYTHKQSQMDLGGYIYMCAYIIRYKTMCTIKHVSVSMHVHINMYTRVIYIYIYAYIQIGPHM